MRVSEGFVVLKQDCVDLRHCVQAMIFVLLIGLASAQLSGLPGEVVFKETPVEISFVVVNESAEARDLAVEFAVVDFEGIDLPKQLKAGESREIKVKLYPKDLAGESYQSKAIVSLGEDRYTKDVLFVFRKAGECPLEFFSTLTEKDNSLVVDFAVKNNSVAEVKSSYLGVEGIPSDWFVRQSGKDLELDGYGLASTQLKVTALSSYTGRARFRFSCNEFTKDAIVDLDYSNPVEGAFSTGFIGLGATVDGELLFNVLLAVIVAVLLISFISRFVKRLNEKR